MGPTRHADRPATMSGLAFHDNPPQDDSVTAERCPSCGGAIRGGAAGCQALMHELMTQAQAEPNYGRVYRLAFDAYCMQHPERYCMSVKSYVAHLTGLCHGLEQANDPEGYWAIPRWLNRPPSFSKPPVPEFRGAITIADVHGASTPQEHGRRVRAWAESVWAAYESQHDLARDWLRQALAASHRL